MLRDDFYLSKLTSEEQRNKPVNFQVLFRVNVEQAPIGDLFVDYQVVAEGDIATCTEIAVNHLHDEFVRNPNDIKVMGDRLETRIWHNDDDVTYHMRFPLLIIKPVTSRVRHISYVHDGHDFYELA